MIQKQSFEVDRELRTLIQWSSYVKFDDIPEAVRRKAVIVLLDDVCAMVAARNEPEIICLQEQLLNHSSKIEATVFQGGYRRTDRYSAAVANAAAANWCELDEGYRKVTCHAGLYSLPALLAEAEAEGHSVRDVLKALVICYEIVTRLARVWKFPSLALHPHAVFGALGASIAIATLRKVNLEDFMNALTSSATLITVGPWDHAVKGALIENMWVASAAWNGMRSVDWAQCGIGGLSSTLNDVYQNTLGAEINIEHFTSNLGEEWAILEGYNKKYACCQYAHSLIEATLYLRTKYENELQNDNIRHILIETHEGGLTLKNYSPQTTLGARFSIPYIVAVVIVLGHADVEAFRSNLLSNQQIHDLMKKFELKPFLPKMDPPYDRPARVTIELHNGKTFSHKCLSAEGGPDRPFTEEDIMYKASQVMHGVYPNFCKIFQMLLDSKINSQTQTWDDLVSDFVS